MTQPNFVEVFTRGTATNKVEMLQLELARHVGDLLHASYPGYLWRVNVDFGGGIVNILCADISMEWGCTLKLRVFADASVAKQKVMQAGGEMLERAGLHRGRMIERELVDAKRDLRGNIITN